MKRLTKQRALVSLSLLLSLALPVRGLDLNTRDLRVRPGDRLYLKPDDRARIW